MFSSCCFFLPPQNCNSDPENAFPWEYSHCVETHFSPQTQKSPDFRAEIHQIPVRGLVLSDPSGSSGHCTSLRAGYIQLLINSRDFRAAGMLCCQLWKSEGCEELSRGRCIPQESRLGFGSVPADPNSRSLDFSVREKRWERGEFCTWMSRVEGAAFPGRRGKGFGGVGMKFSLVLGCFREYFKCQVWDQREVRSLVLEFRDFVAGTR